MILTRESWKITSVEGWQKRRGKDITASVAPNLIEGADPYGSVQRVVDHLNGVRGEQTPAMRAGIIAEAMFPDAVAIERPEWTLVKAITYHRIPELRLGATPDFWIFDERCEEPVKVGLLQAKTCSERTWERWHGVPPLGYTIQTHIELTCTGEEYGVLAVIVRSDLMPLHLFEVRRHATAESKILAAVAEFWRAYDAGEYPVAVPKDEIAAMLDDGSHVDLSDDPKLPAWLEKRETMVANRAWAEREIKGIDYELKQRMGQASTAYVPGWDISWKSQHRKEFTVQAQDIRVLRVKRTQETNDE